ncbi:hypothetical protein OG357_02795 [Streptomyces sp. NBC_01255]|uniref:hypothetical protein n=1 Tax=Streptomyces sp. NBC_01255 TaxID=2903798 RepID=UPI002E34B0B4|nr:hypothetical protein [Streptomyces sp. NBC_01255]
MTFDENEPEDVRERRFADERARRRARRNSTPIDLRGAHIGVAVVIGALLLLAWFGELLALGVVGGIFLLWFAIALTWVHADGGRGRHAFQRAYGATFGWGDGL